MATKDYQWKLETYFFFEMWEKPSWTWAWLISLPVLIKSCIQRSQVARQTSTWNFGESTIFINLSIFLSENGQRESKGWTWVLTLFYSDWFYILMLAMLKESQSHLLTYELVISRSLSLSLFLDGKKSFNFWKYNICIHILIINNFYPLFPLCSCRHEKRPKMSANQTWWRWNVHISLEFIV